MKLRTKNAWKGVGLILPLLIGCIIFYGVPFVLVGWYSVVQGGQFIAFDTYIRLLENPVFRIALKNTLGFLVVGLTLILLISYAVALLLKDTAGRSKWLQSVVMLPFVMPVVGTVVLVDALFAETGLWSKLYTALGLPVADWLQEDSAFWIVVGLYLWKNTGYSVLILLSGLVSVPREQYAAAALDGASAWQRFG